MKRTAFDKQLSVPKRDAGEVAGGAIANRPIVVVAAIAIAIAPFVIFLYGFVDGALWVGRMTVPVTVTVGDIRTRQPIANARVRLVRPGANASAVTASTTPDGRAVLQGTFQATGNSSRWKNTCTVLFDYYWVECSSPGYRSARVGMVERAGHRLDPRTTTPRPFHILLEPEDPAKKGPLAAIAGEYVRGDSEAIVTLRVDADGHVQMMERDLVGKLTLRTGTARLRNGSLALSFAEPHVDPNARSMPALLNVVAWDQRLYLVAPGELAGFEAEEEQGREPRSDAFGAFFLREGDWQKSAVGQPAISTMSQDDSKNQNVKIPGQN
jgi:hypothetical protein